MNVEQLMQREIARETRPPEYRHMIEERSGEEDSIHIHKFRLSACTWPPYTLAVLRSKFYIILESSPLSSLLFISKHP
jgi:hypothetical protein